MGSRFSLKWKNIKYSWKYTFVVTFIIGMLVHIYKFTNTLINHDGVYNYYSDQNILGSGRWFLSIACGFSSYFDLPWINGLFSILFIALTAVVIVDIFKLENRFLMLLISALLVTFPGTIETFYFGFTADGYMLAMLLAALAVRFSLLEESRKRNFFIALILICLSCGIYQAYVSFAMVLALCYFANDLLEGRHHYKEYLRWIKIQLLIYIGSLASYYLIWKVCMLVQHVQVNSYQGIDEVGRISVGLIIDGFINTIRTLVFFILEWNVLKHGWTLYGVINVILLFLGMLVVFAVIKKSKITQEKMKLTFFIFCLLAMPFAACIWHFTSSSVVYRPMMLQSLCVIYIWIAILYDRWIAEKWSTVVGGLLVVMIFNNSIQANIAYFHLDQCYKESYAMGVEMVSRIHLLDEGNLKKIAVVGNTSSEVCLVGEQHEESRLQLLGQLLESNILYDQKHTVLFLQNTFDLKLQEVSQNELRRLEISNVVKKMTCWPHKDSLQIMGDTVVIKLADLEEEVLE